jgi:hypothetical protein
VKLKAAPGLIVKQWGEPLAVVYCPATAKTHLVTAQAAALLLSAADFPYSISETGPNLEAEFLVAEGLIEAGLMQALP